MQRTRLRKHAPAPTHPHRHMNTPTHAHSQTHNKFLFHFPYATQGYARRSDTRCATRRPSARRASCRPYTRRATLPRRRAHDETLRAARTKRDVVANASHTVTSGNDGAEAPTVTTAQHCAAPTAHMTRGYGCHTLLFCRETEVPR